MLDQNRANPSPQTPFTISALKMPIEAPAAAGESPFSGKMTNHVIIFGGNAPRQTAAA
jgi:hypothetical protein